MKVRGKSNAMKIISVIVILVIVICFFVLMYEFIKIGNLKSKNAQLEKTSSALQQEYAELDSKTNYVGDPDNPYSNYQNYLEDYAREVLNWGKEGHTYFIEK